MPSRRETLEAFVRERPGDAFARYGLALELMQSGDDEAALAEFDRLAALHPDYVAGHQQAAQLLLRLQRHGPARLRLQQGIAAAVKTGNAKARAEMEAMLEEMD